MQDPIDTLMAEHRIIEKVLDALEIAAEREMPVSFYERALDFFAAFADRCHHLKEEERLFPVLETHGIPREMGPIGVMCEEHVVGRAHVQRMREQLRLGRRDALCRESLEYVALLRQHIRKEDEVLFQMARQVMRGDEVRRLAGAFEEADGHADPRGAYAKVADALLAEARTA
ncbi:MAG TPA: hemerythrin domain-containing protein [Planctomycetota bacterium]|nr:hemerythrin domain-containing protein [Planctomycetota bacterium]